MSGHKKELIWGPDAQGYVKAHPNNNIIYSQQGIYLIPNPSGEGNIEVTATKLREIYLSKTLCKDILNLDEKPEIPLFE